MLTNEDLSEYKQILQSVIDRKIRAKEFPSINIESYFDEFGNIFGVIIVEILQDMGNEINFQVVLYSPAYAQYWRNKKLNNSSNNGTLSVTDRDF